MENNENIKDEPSLSENEVTTPDENEVSTVTLKYNKENITVPVEKAKLLAQKGLKFEKICDDYERLKNLATASNQSVCEFLSEYEKRLKDEKISELTKRAGGNRELAEEVYSLKCENKEQQTDFDELKKEFPEISQIGELPKEVLDAAELKGSRLLDEYLRYLLKCKRKKEEREDTCFKAVGSQKSRCFNELNDSAVQFVNGVWSR